MESSVAENDNRALTATAGASITLVCIADGIPAPSIQWSYDGNVIDSSQKLLISESMGVEIRPLVGASVVSTLVLRSLVEGDSGNYSCTANNGVEQADSMDVPYQLIVTPRIIDYCYERMCMNGGTCVDGPSYFVCSCPMGVIGNMCQTVLAILTRIRYPISHILGSYSFFPSPDRQPMGYAISSFQ